MRFNPRTIKNVQVIKEMTRKEYLDLAELHPSPVQV